MVEQEEEEDEATTVEVFGKMTWCLIPEDAVLVIVILDVPIVFFTLIGFGRLLVTVIFADEFFVELGLFMFFVVVIVV